MRIVTQEREKERGDLPASISSPTPKAPVAAQSGWQSC